MISLADFSKRAFIVIAPAAILPTVVLALAEVMSKIDLIGLYELAAALTIILSCCTTIIVSQNNDASLGKRLLLILGIALFNFMLYSIIVALFLTVSIFPIEIWWEPGYIAVPAISFLLFLHWIIWELTRKANNDNSLSVQKKSDFLYWLACIVAVLLAVPFLTYALIWVLAVIFAVDVQVDFIAIILFATPLLGACLPVARLEYYALKKLKWL